MSTKLVFLGDYCDTNPSDVVLQPTLQDVFSTARLVCINLEAPIINNDHCSSPKAGPEIGQSKSVLERCRQWGVTHFALANNHIMDYGADGLRSTLEQLKGEPFFGAGLQFDQAYQPCYVETGGKRIALLAFAEAQFGVLQDDATAGQAGYAWVDHPQARQAVRDARTVCNHVIVQVHAGLEMVGLPLPEWRLRYRELIDLGADLVIGHHPHVIQGSECYKGKMIYYSLGNFYMDVMLRQADSGSGAALVVTVTDDGLETEFIPLASSLTNVGIDQSGSGTATYQQLCAKLSNAVDYYAEIQSVCDEFWEQVYSGYYESALFGLGTRPCCKSVYKLLRRLAGRVLHGQGVYRASELLLIHNIRIETHRWVVERALKKSSGCVI